MFIEERLENAHLNGTVLKEISQIICENKQDGINGIRKVDYAWVSFCKKHEEYEPQAVKAIAYKAFQAGGSDVKRAFYFLHWSKEYETCKSLVELNS